MFTTSFQIMSGFLYYLLLCGNILFTNLGGKSHILPLIKQCLNCLNICFGCLEVLQVNSSDDFEELIKITEKILRNDYEWKGTLSPQKLWGKWRNLILESELQKLSVLLETLFHYQFSHCFQLHTPKLFFSTNLHQIVEIC